MSTHENPLTDVQTYLRDGANYDHGRSIRDALGNKPVEPKVTPEQVRELIARHEKEVEEWWFEKAGEVADNLSRAFPPRDLKLGEEVKL